EIFECSSRGFFRSRNKRVFPIIDQTAQRDDQELKISNNAPIGVIDSGVGGLTVVKEMLNYLPNETIIYIGDDARCPYGPRSVEEVKQFTMEMATALAEMGIKMLVVACNTATAVTLELLRERFPFPVLGVIEPGARAAVLVSSTERIAV